MTTPRILKTTMCSTALMAALGSNVQAEDRLTVAFYGGSWGDAIQECIVDTFAEQTGVTVVPEPGVSTVTLGKLKQQRDNPAIDVAWLDGGISEIAAEEGLVASLDPGAIPGIDNVIEEGVYKTSGGDIFALGTGYYALGLVYNTEEIDQAPTSWWDLWKEEYAGLSTVPAPSNAMGVPFFLLINELSGGDIDNLDPGVEKMGELDVSSFFDASGNASNSFQTGEVIIGAHYATAAWSLADSGVPIAYSVPEEGAPTGDIRVHIVEGTSNKELAQQFVDHAVAVDQATCMVNRLYVGPATKGVEPSDEAKERLPWGADGSIDDLRVPDWNAINPNRDRITKTFNQEVTG